MDHERRQPVETLKLTRVRQGARGPIQRKITGRLARGGLEHVHDLPVDRLRRPGPRQDDEAEEFIVVLQRHNQPQTLVCQQPRRYLQPIIGVGIAAQLREINHPLVLGEKSATTVKSVLLSTVSSARFQARACS